MASLEKQLEYLFRSSQDLYVKGLAKARSVGPERAAAFAAGFVYGRTTALLATIQQGAIEHELVEAYQVGAREGQQSFEPPKGSRGPAEPTDEDPLGATIDVTIN